MSESVVVCPNCSQEKIARFCAHCGQNHRDFRRALPPVLWELFREAFEVDGRIVKSLKLLVTKPGQLSVEFAQNHRASYMSPIRFYLFSSILFFFVLSQITDVPEITRETIEPIAQDSVARQDSLEYLYSLLTEDQAAQARRLVANEDDFASEAIVNMANDTYTAYQSGHSQNIVEIYLLGQFIDVFADPQDFLERSLDNAPFTMFFLLPFYAFLLKIIYIRSGKYFVEHLVFALHLHSLAFLLLTVQILAPLEEAIGVIRGALVFVFFVYYFLALRRFYGQGLAKTIIKYGFLLVAYAILMGPSLLATFVLTATLL